MDRSARFADRSGRLHARAIQWHATCTTPDEDLLAARSNVWRAPTHLVEAAAEWSHAEIRWIVENGIEMSGMPAFGPHHDEEEITQITAFVSRLPGLSSGDYSH